MTTNFTSQTITQQIATRSGQIGISSQNGVYTYVNLATGQAVPGRTVTSTLLANPQRPNDPKLKNQALELARGYYDIKTTPEEFIEAIASVAAYVSTTNGIPVANLFANNTISLQLISAYNAFQPKGNQVGVFVGTGNPAWSNNPVLRGTVASAIVDQP